jgi:hypothetical protein
MPADDRDSREPAVSRVDPSTPHPARRYDYLLGGKDNFAADREAADEIVARHPTARVVYVDNDPLVLVHARALLTSDPRGKAAYLEADLREPARSWKIPSCGTRSTSPSRSASC